MDDEEKEPQPILSHVEPVLAVRDILETITYWKDILGFPYKWTWGDPPNHGGVSWHAAFIQFSLNPVLALAPAGNTVWIRVRQLDLLYKLHQRLNAEIVVPLENKPWGMAEYIVKEINGYFLHFSASVSDRDRSAPTLQHAVRIVRRTPTIKENRDLISAAGWSTSGNDEIVNRILAAAVFAVLAEDIVNGETVGCAFLLGDQASFYYVKDVMVHPQWQGKRVGSALMQELTRWLEKNAADDALVGLYTGENLALFYQQFGFKPVFGMTRRIQRIKKNE